MLGIGISGLRNQVKANQPPSQHIIDLQGLKYFALHTFSVTNRCCTCAHTDHAAMAQRYLERRHPRHPMATIIMQVDIN